MTRSPHKKPRVASPVSTRKSTKDGPGTGTGIWLPMGHRRGENRPAGGGEPGKSFKDPNGRLHIIPRKTKKKAGKTRGTG